MNKIFIFLMLAGISVDAQKLQVPIQNQSCFTSLFDSKKITPLNEFTNDLVVLSKDTALVNRLKTLVENHNILSGSYSGKSPAEVNTGAIKVEHAIYEETVIGAGTIQWSKITVPQERTRTSVQTDTFSNFMVSNTNGTFQINTSNGNSLQFVTSEEGGMVGWAKVDSLSKLFLDAKYVAIPGQLYVQGLIKTEAGISIGDINSTKLDITSTTISFNSDSHRFLGIDNNPWHEGLVLTANGTDGIIVNSVGSINGGGMIRLASNSQIIASFYSNGTVIGDGLPGSSGLLTLISSKKGFIPPRMDNEHIFAINNPEEGTEVYSLTEHAPVFYNGSNWMQPSQFKILQNPNSNANISSL